MCSSFRVYYGLDLVYMFLMRRFTMRVYASWKCVFFRRNEEEDDQERMAGPEDWRTLTIFSLPQLKSDRD